MDVPSARTDLPVSNEQVSDEDIRISAAREQFKAGNYAAAEPLLRQLLEGSAVRKDETICMLAETTWLLGKWDAADRLFDQQFNGRASLMGRLARDAIDANKDSAERLLRKHFEGKEPLMELLAEAYVKEEKWDKAKRLLVELLYCETDQQTRTERMHALGYVCFAEGSWREAEAWCLKAIMGGENEATTLLARIYNTENMDHAAYESVLGELSPGIQEQLCLLDKREAAEQVGKTVFRRLSDTKRQSVRHNILQHGIMGSGRGWSLIHEIASRGAEVALQLLLDKGADIEAKCDAGTPLIVAAEYGHKNAVKLLLERGANIEAKSKTGTALGVAVLKGHERCVQVLLEHGATTEAKSGETPLIVAAIYGYEGIVRLLLEKNANMEATSKLGTPLIEATWGGSLGIVRMLLDKGANIEASSREGTALNIAAMNGYEEIVQVLLDRGANIESKNREGKTPLIMASKNEQANVCKLLLGRGADVKAKDTYGSTALSLANQAPASKGTTLLQMTDLHMTDTVATLVRELQRRHKQNSK